MSAVDVSPSVAIVATFTAAPFHSIVKVFPLATIKITSTATGGRVSIGGSDLGLDMTKNTLKSLAGFLVKQLKSGQTSKLWSWTLSGSNYVLYYNGTSTGVSQTKGAWKQLGLDLYAWIG